MSNNRNWGQGGPQKSDTGAGTRPNWGQGGPQKSDTGAGTRSNWGQGGPQKSDTEALNPRGSGGRHYDIPVCEVYILNNVMYKNVRLISEESGEAKIFEIEDKVGTHYALKIYRYGIKPNHAILDKIMDLRDNGLLINIYDHGTWHDDPQNVDFDYEVMQLCTGGSLATTQLEGKEDKLKEFALKMTAAIDFLHRKGIVHRDVKPANFLFTDKNRRNFVLTDWGFAKLLDKNGRAVTDDGRTKLYTAPELYINIPGQDTYVDAKADFFSLGMSLLALWKGEGLLIADEQKLVRQKLDEELPYPSRKEMSEYSLSLIKALTRNNPDKRAGYDEIKRWSNGEIIFHDPESDNLVNDYKIVFSGEKNLIAHNHEELGKIMWDNKDLAKKYLYNDKIANWLEDVDRPEMAVRMKEITEMEYPSNQDTGLYAACMELMPDMPFYGVKGNEVTTQKELAHELLYNAGTYIESLGSYEEQIWVYCRAVGLGKEIKNLAAKGCEKRRAYIFELAYKLDNALPYFVPVKDNGKTTNAVKTVKAYAEAFYSADNEYFFYQARPDFLRWLQNIDPALYGRAQTMLAKYGSNVNPNMLIHYAILPDLGFDGKPLNVSAMSTPEKIAEVLTVQHCLKVENKPYRQYVDFEKFKNSSLHVYLLSKEKYSKQISYADYCMELKSVDNNRKCAPYGPETAALKIMAGWHGGSIPLTLHGHTFTSPKDIDKVNLSSYSKQEQNLLVHWLSLFFQEDPNANYTAKSYTKRALELFEFIEPRLKKSAYIALCNNSSFNDVDGAVSRNKRAWIKVRTVQVLSIVLCFIPMLLVCGAIGYLSVTTGSVPIEMAMKSLGHWAAIIIGVIGAICCVDGGIIGMAIGGFVVYWLVELLFKFLAPIVPWLVIALLLATVVFFGRKIFIIIGKRFGSKDFTISEIKLRHRAGLAFSSRSILLPGKSMDYPIHDINENTSYANSHMPKLIKNSLLMLALSAAGVFLCGWIIKNYDKDYIAPVESVEGFYNGDVQGTPSTITLYKNDNGLWEAEMVINYRAGKTRQIMIANEKSDEPGTLYHKENPEVSLTFHPRESADDSKSLFGTYINSKGNKRTVNYKQTETAKE